MPRALEIVICIVALFLLAPLFLVLMLAIVLDSPGWPFFLQQRVGKNGRLFQMIKFRKMPRFVPKDGKGITTANDIRLTRMGRMLERFKFDELPQFFNVVSGSMSLVGPRPEIPRFTAHYPEKWQKVLSVRPGVVGYSQINVPHETDLYPPDCLDHEAYYIEHILPDKLDNEIEYIARKSAYLDFFVLFKVSVSLLTHTITPRWVLARYWHFHMLLSDTLLSCICLYSAYLLVHQAGMPSAAHSQLETAMWNNLWIRPLVFFLFSLHKYPFSSSLTLGYLFRIVKTSIYSSIVLIIVLILIHAERDLILSAHIVDMFILPSFLVGIRLFYIALHDSLIAVGFFKSIRHALSHVAAALIFGAIGIFTFWLGYFIRTPADVSARFTQSEFILPMVFLIRSGLSLLIWPPVALSRTEMVKKDFIRILNNALFGTGMILTVHLILQLEEFSRLALTIDFAVYTGIVVSLSAFWSLQKIQKDTEIPKNKILIYGVGVETELFLNTIERMPSINCNIIGIVSDLGWKRFSTISGINVIGTVSDLPAIIEMHKPSVILTWERVTESEFFPLVKDIAGKYDIPLSISPSVHSLVHQPIENKLFAKAN
jgi:lipopolysaccharide/colanic/teichoic acid biosynthesis glycosyltransferase